MNGLVVPRFELQPVDDDQVRRVQLSHFAGRELKIVRLSPGRQQILNLRQVPGHVDRETPDWKEAGDHLYLPRFPAPRPVGKSGDQQQRKKTKNGFADGKSHVAQYFPSGAYLQIICITRLKKIPATSAGRKAYFINSIWRARLIERLSWR